MRKQFSLGVTIDSDIKSPVVITGSGNGDRDNLGGDYPTGPFG